MSSRGGGLLVIEGEREEEGERAVKWLQRLDSQVDCIWHKAQRWKKSGQLAQCTQHTPCSCTHLTMPLAPTPHFLFHSAPVYALLTGSSGVCLPLRQGIFSALRASPDPGWLVWRAVVQSCCLHRLVSTSLCAAPLRACHLTAHSVPHWLVLSITIYLLLEWQQPLHLTSLFHQLWIDYWMWTSARACCWTHLLAGIR